jgi:hypothetical protein
MQADQLRHVRFFEVAPDRIAHGLVQLLERVRFREDRFPRDRANQPPSAASSTTKMISFTSSS